MTSGRCSMLSQAALGTEETLVALLSGIHACMFLES